MTRSFKTGDHVRWNSEAGRVAGTIIKVHRKDLSTKDTPITPRWRIPSTKSKAINQIILPFIRRWR